MGLRFRKSIKLAPGLKLNLNTKSVSISGGTKGVRHTISSSGRSTTTIGIPGTGIYYTKSHKRKKGKKGKKGKKSSAGLLDGLFSLISGK